MGCDIHPVLEIRDTLDPLHRWHAQLWPNKYHDHWDDEPEQSYRFFPAKDRNYVVFAILANVRNGTPPSTPADKYKSGYDYYPPIDEPRGLPDDIAPETEKALTGDHSESYVTLRELLDYNWGQTRTQKRLLDVLDLYNWRKAQYWEPFAEPRFGHPQYNYDNRPTQVVDPDALYKDACKHVDAWQRLSGINVNNAPSHLIDVLQPLSHKETEVTYEVLFAQDASTFYTHAIPIMRNLVPPGGTVDDVRLVFNFDS